jgi:hypothetical protein
MIAFPEMLLDAAEKAGIKVPPHDFKGWDEKEWDTNEYSHWTVFCNLQLGKSVRYHGEHWENAKIIAEIPEDKIKTMMLEDFIRAGFSY